MHAVRTWICCVNDSFAANNPARGVRKSKKERERE